MSSSGAFRLDPAALSNAAVYDALDALYRAQIRLQNRFIALGRGMERPQMHGRGDDRADDEWRENAYRIDELEGQLKKRGAWKLRKPPVDRQSSTRVCGTAT